MATRILKHRSITGKDLTIHYITDDAAAIAACELLLQEKVIGFDTETTPAKGFEIDPQGGLDPYKSLVRLVQFARYDGTVFVIDVFKMSSKGKAAIRAVLEAEYPIKVGHNLKFDIKMSRYHFEVVYFGKIFCTELMSRLITGGLEWKRISLVRAAERHLGITVSKEEQRSDWSKKQLSVSQLCYSADDAFIVLPLRDTIVKSIVELELTRAAKLELEAVDPVCTMELSGFYLNSERWLEAEVTAAARRLELAELIWKGLEGVVTQRRFAEGMPLFKIGSQKIMTELLTDFGITLPEGDKAKPVKPKKKKTAFNDPAAISLFGDLSPTGTSSPTIESAARDAARRAKTTLTTRNWKIKPLANRFEIISMLIEWRELNKRVTSYGEEYLHNINAVSGRIHADYDPMRAVTGRYGVSKPNLQQIPHIAIYRRCFMPGDGYKLVGADYCLAQGTGIYTQRGIVPIEDVRVGDLALQPDGSYRAVIRTAYSGVKDCLLTTTQDGLRVVPTAEHNFRVFSIDGYGWKQAHSITSTDVVHIFSDGAPENSTPILLPLPQAGHYKEHPHLVAKLLTADFAELLGYMIGDGSFNSKGVSFVVNQQDTDVYDTMLDKALRHFGMEHATESAYRGVVEATFNSTQISRWLRTDLVIGNGQFNVPLFTQNTDVLKAVLRGYFEADGSVTDGEHGRVSCASSKQLCTLSVQLMLNYLGIQSVVRTQHNTGPDKNKTAYVLTLLSRDTAKFQKLVGFLSDRKNQKLANLIAVRQTGQNKANRGVPFLSSAGLSRVPEVNILLANARNLGRRISPEIAARVTVLDPEYARALQLDVMHVGSFQTTERTTYAPQHTFDLEIEDTNTFVANGFVVHNSQIELRELAEFSGDQGFIDAFLSGLDFHDATTLQMFSEQLVGAFPNGADKPPAKGTPEYDAWKTTEGFDRWTKYRTYAKNINFGIPYGMGAMTLSIRTGMSFEEAQKHLDLYKQRFPKVIQYLNMCANRVYRTGEIRTSSGRLARFRFDRNDDAAVAHAKNNGKNTPIQGGNADILKRAVRLLHDALHREGILRPYGGDIFMVNIVHDEIVTEARDAMTELASQLLETTMLAAAEEVLKVVPVKVEAQVSAEWGK